MKFAPSHLEQSPDMAGYGGEVTRHSADTWTYADDTPVEGRITAEDVERLSSADRQHLKGLYESALLAMWLTYNELPRELQTKVFATGDLTEAKNGIDIHVGPDTPTAPYNHSFIDALEIKHHPPTVNDRRALDYTGGGVLLSGGVNNFVLEDVGEGDYDIGLLALQRNAVSNDLKTPLADALKLQGPGGGRVENVVGYPELGATETKEEVLTDPTLKMGRAIIQLPWLNPSRIRVFTGGDTPVAAFSAHPFIDRANNTLEAYQNALHPVGKGLSMTEDLHAPDKLALDNGKFLYRANNAAVVDLDTLISLAGQDGPEFTRSKSGLVRAAVLDELRYRQDKDGNYAVEATGLTPQLNNLVDSGLVAKLIALRNYANDTREGNEWAKNATAQYRRAA